MKKIWLNLILLIALLVTWCTTQSIINNPAINPIKKTVLVENQEEPVVDIRYTIKTGDRWENVWEDIFVYDENDNLVLSLVDEEEPQYYFSLLWNYLVLDNWTSASQRLIQVYDIANGTKIFESDYYPWEDGLTQEWNTIRFFQRIDNANLQDYTIWVICENEYDNGYIELYWYELWKDSATSLWTIKCAYFE